ncbi:MAG: EamA family transporter [Lachnospiraceae bacterium]|nr:EamA family transporter [bacterium]MDY5518156.1 EamA family transporter [Lachnospiraceae bacterium]
MKKFAPLLILIAGVLWGSMGLFVRTLNGQGLASMEIVGLRAAVTTVALFLFLLLFDRKLFHIRLKDLWCFLGTGICSIVFFNFCYFKAITMTSLSVAAILLYTAPAIVMVLSYFLFREKLAKRKLLALGMTFIGCVLVTGILSETGSVSAGGILVGMGAGLGYALYSIFSRYALEKGYASLTITFYTFLIAAIASCFLTDMGKVAQVATDGAGNLLFCLAFGVLCTVAPYLTYTLGLQYVENGKASIIASIEPVTATLLGVILFHENLTFSGALGIVLVLVALVLCNDSKANDA